MDVHSACRAAGVDPSLAVDPTEGYASAQDVITLMESVQALDAEVASAIAYVEQPVPRRSTPDAELMRRASGLVWVLMDEALTDVSTTPLLAEQGWSGIVTKAGKG